MNQVTIGLIGLGTVGTGVARLVTEQPRADRPPRRPADSTGSGPRFVTPPSRATSGLMAFALRPM